MVKPEEYKEFLSEFKPCVFDSYCGEPISWGFEFVNRMSEEEFEKLQSKHKVECCYPRWFLITKKLTKEEAIIKYGEITDIELGPRGGFRSITFGDKKFLNRELYQ